jgi:signal transduction histidine kinase
LRRRIVAATLLVALAAIAVLGIPLLLLTQRQIVEAAKAELLREAQSIGIGLDAAYDRGETDQLALERLVPAGHRAVIVNERGGWVEVGQSQGRDPVETTLPLANGGLLTVQRSRSEIRTQQLEVALVVAGAAALAVVIAVLLAFRAAGRLSGPLALLAEDAAKLGGGDFRPSGRHYGIVELDAVAGVLDSSAVRLADLLRRERELAGDISHQLRSRLTALSMRLEEINGSGDPLARREAEAALEQVDRMVSVVDDLLEQARADRARHAVEVDLCLQIEELRGEWESVFAAKGRRLRLSVEAGAHAVASPGHLQQVLGVLVENAFVHGDGTVTISAQRVGEHVAIEVSDEGEGVAAQLVPSIFARGVSGAGSTGLGLALARALVEVDSGRLELRQARPATFALYLPGSGPVIGP